MSHLPNEVCGCDFFISYNICDVNIVKFVECFKLFLSNNKLTYYSSDLILFNQNYLEILRLQAIRSKIFLYLIDKYSLECEWFLNLFLYAKEYNQINNLPILIPVILNKNVDTNEVFDFNKKPIKDLISLLTKESFILFKMSEIDSFEKLITLLKDAIDDLIPIKNFKSTDIQHRHVDNFRPISFKEEDFLNRMKNQENDLMKKFKISKSIFKTFCTNNKIYVSLSVSHNELKNLIFKMINANNHLVWIDVITINREIFFNLLWVNNYFELEKEKQISSAKPPSYLIFFDLNVAQMAKLYKEYSIDQNWNLELIDSYVKETRSGLLTRRRMIRNSRFNSTTKSHEELFFICQFKNINNFENKISNKESLFNKLQHGIIDKNFTECMKETLQLNINKQNYIPVKITLATMNVNTITNIHFYFSILYKPIEYKEEHDVYTDLYCFKRNLNDQDLLNLYHEYTKINWKLIDLKAYKDEKSITKFSAIWTSIDHFYEGSSKLFIGLNKAELLRTINEMSLKKLYPRLITNYGYLNLSNEHVYVVFFCQF